MVDLGGTVVAHLHRELIAFVEEVGHENHLAKVLSWVEWRQYFVLHFDCVHQLAIFSIHLSLISVRRWLDYARLRLVLHLHSVQCHLLLVILLARLSKELLLLKVLLLFCHTVVCLLVLVTFAFANTPGFGACFHVTIQST